MIWKKVATNVLVMPTQTISLPLRRERRDYWQRMKLETAQPSTPPAELNPKLLSYMMESRDDMHAVTSNQISEKIRQTHEKS